MKRAKKAATLLAATGLMFGAAAANAQTTLEEFQWNKLAPAGVQDWTVGSNWMAPTAPPGNATYPDDPMHTDVDTEAIGPVVGANLAVGLTSDLNVSIGNSDITISSLKLGVNGRTTTISGGTGTLLFKQDEPSLIEVKPDPDDEEDPPAMVDFYTCSFNCGTSLVTSLGSTSTNVISAKIGSVESIDFSGPRTLTLSGGLYEVASSPADDTTSNNTIFRSHIGTYNPAVGIDNQPRLLVTGPLVTVDDKVLNADMTPTDQALTLNGGGPGTPQFLNDDNTEFGQGFAHGIIDLAGGISGPGKLRLGTQSRADEAVPLGTVVLYDNTYTGGTTIDRGNVILRSNNAFGPTGTVQNGNPANQIGYNLIVEPGVGESAVGLERVITNPWNVPHDFTVKGQHSLKLTGNAPASNSAGWVNNLEPGATFTMTGRIYTSENPENIYTFDGSGRTVIQGVIANAANAFLDSGGPQTTMFQKLGTGTVVVESSLHGATNTFKAGTSNPTSDTILISGGNLHFAAIGDMGAASGTVRSTGGAIGVDTGTIAAVNNGSGNFANRFSNFAMRPTYPGLFPNSEVPGFSEYDNGGLMLTTAADAAAAINFTTGNMARFQDMTLAAPEGGMTFTGTITPANSTYRLGGGSGTLTIAASKLAGAPNLVVTNGGDYKNPNGEDRERLGMVRLTGTTTNALSTKILARYHSTLQDQAAADDVALAEEEQLQGTTLAVASLADGASSIGSSTSAGSLLIQGSTLRYEGAAGSTNRQFTIGTAGATLDASGTGAINFTSTDALTMDTAQSRGGIVDSFEKRGGTLGGDLYDLGDTSDLLIGMGVSGNLIPDDTVITRILSPTRVALSNAVEEGTFATNTTVSFTEVDRYLTLTGDNAGDNRLAAQIVDSANSGVVGVEKSGAGKWVLSNAANNYTGDTIVEDGVLSLEAAFLADSSDVRLFEDGTLDLNFAGSDDINSLYFNDLPVSIGTWGSLASGADNKRDWFTGLGILNVGMLGAIGDLAGDFNRDGVVNAADYTVWRDNDGAANEDALNGNGDGLGGIDGNDLALWKSNYGATLASASLDTGAVPEPSVLVLMLAAAPLGLRGRRR
ncbi:Autotransporter-associated beta strand repeat protein [Posidoniimonas polymericola]|uniref:Autotransporter-associated beta strand repeat protein n=1 Tax=Posidoniimonas polymericola TaxID=2528002 RepID=A0A5C5YRP5_9BACT|nr:autotransporter-associated beta strand repeat-containing protein [Posidoniimonas polymericola]TWT77592.1 Autotransporter-associated beta strand repeat protein [Posidoniimonas polymericola]